MHITIILTSHTRGAHHHSHFLQLIKNQECVAIDLLTTSWAKKPPQGCPMILLEPWILNQVSIDIHLSEMCISPYWLLILQLSVKLEALILSYTNWLLIANQECVAIDQLATWGEGAIPKLPHDPRCHWSLENQDIIDILYVSEMCISPHCGRPLDLSQHYKRLCVMIFIYILTSELKVYG